MSAKTSPTTLSADQRKALTALATARKYAKHLRRFITPEYVLTTDNDIDDFFRAIENLGKESFGCGDVCLDAALAAAGVGTVNSDLVRDLDRIHADQLDATRMSAFALGVAWGRLEGGAR